MEQAGARDGGHPAAVAEHAATPLPAAPDAAEEHSAEHASTPLPGISDAIKERSAEHTDAAAPADRSPDAPAETGAAPSPSGPAAPDSPGEVTAPDAPAAVTAADAQDLDEPPSADAAADAVPKNGGSAVGSPIASPPADGTEAAGTDPDTDAGETHPPTLDFAEPPESPRPHRWWRRPAVLSATALAAMAALTLIAVVRSPAATAGSNPGGTRTDRATGASRAGTTAPSASASHTAAAKATSSAPTSAPTTTPTTPAADVTPAALSAQDAVAEAVRRAGVSGRLSVAVVDADGGPTATWNSSSATAYDTASIVKVDILAALLLRDQHKGTALTGEQRSLAVRMIENSDNDAALDLWQTIGRASGLAAANAELGLRHTQGGSGDLWGLTQTTASDQITLLRAVFDGGSPLSAASRSYLGGLMRSVTDGQTWGVPAADSDGSGFAVKNGWLPRSATGLWDINSIGEVVRDGRRLLVSVLSDGQHTEQGGIDQVERVARAAAQAYVDATP